MSEESRNLRPRSVVIGPKPQNPMDSIIQRVLLSVSVERVDISDLNKRRQKFENENLERGRT